MLLGDILSGKESSHLVLVHDSVSQNGRPLIYCFAKSLLQSVDFVHAILWDVPPEHFLGAFDVHLRERICCYDGFSDPLGWNLPRNKGHSHTTAINQNSNVVQAVNNNMLHHSPKDNSGNTVKVAVVVDSLSRLLLWKSSSSVCTFLNQLYTNSVDSQTGYQVVQVVCLVHGDLHDDQKLNAINFLASSILWITEAERQTNTDKANSWCKILHKRKTGKVVKKVGGFTISDYQLTECEEKHWNVSSSVSCLAQSEVDPTQNLTFNLKLTDSERQARANLKLPYMHHEKERGEVTVNPSGEGKVFYQPDEADDFDEDDPDDDLDI